MAFTSEYSARIIISGSVGASGNSDGTQYIMNGTEQAITYINSNLGMIDIQCSPENGNYIELSNSTGFKKFLQAGQAFSAIVNPDNPLIFNIKGDTGDLVFVNEVI